MIWLIIYALIVHYISLFTIICLLLNVDEEIFKLMIWQSDREREKKNE